MAAGRLSGRRVWLVGGGWGSWRGLRRVGGLVLDVGEEGADNGGLHGLLELGEEDLGFDACVVVGTVVVGGEGKDTEGVAEEITDGLRADATERGGDEG